jgi:hypothetical protein
MQGRHSQTWATRAGLTSPALLKTLNPASRRDFGNAPRASARGLPIDMSTPSNREPSQTRGIAWRTRAPRPQEPARQINSSLLLIYEPTFTSYIENRRQNDRMSAKFIFLGSVAALSPFPAVSRSHNEPKSQKVMGKVILCAGRTLARASRVGSQRSQRNGGTGAQLTTEKALQWRRGASPAWAIPQDSQGSRRAHRADKINFSQSFLRK